MEKRFTNGDWMVSAGCQIVAMPSQCKISNAISGWNHEEAEANARLISAAPNLLEALTELTEWVCSLTDWAGGTTLDPDTEKCKNVIKKATE